MALSVSAFSVKADLPYLPRHELWRSQLCAPSHAVLTQPSHLMSPSTFSVEQSQIQASSNAQDSTARGWERSPGSGMHQDTS